MAHPTHSGYLKHIHHVVCCVCFFLGTIGVNAQEDTRYKYIFDLVNDGNYEAAKTEVNRAGTGDIRMDYTTTRSSSVSNHKPGIFSIFLIPFIIFDGLTPKTRHHSVSLLEYSVAKGYSASKNNFIEFLLKHGADPDKYYGRLSPMAIAVSKNENDLAKLLFRYGADPSGYRLSRDENPFLIAVKNNNGEMLRFFMENKVSLPPNAAADLLASAMASGDTAMFDLFLTSGRSVESTRLIGKASSIIVKEKKTMDDGTLAAMVQKLTANGFKPDSADRNGNLPLHAALNEGCEGLARALLPYTPNLNAQNGDGETPLMLAVENAQSNFVQVLLDHKADISPKNGKGETARDIAIRKNYMAMADLLESTDAGVRERNQKLALLLLDGNVPKAKRTDSALAFIRAGISTDACRIRPYISHVNPNYSGPCYFLHHAVKKGYYEIAEALLKAGADPNAKDGELHDLPLQYALSYSDTNMARLLLKYGADVNDVRLKRSVMFYTSYRNGGSFTDLCSVRDLLLREIRKDIHPARGADGRYYYADKQGNNLFSFTADSIQPFSSYGYARVTKNARWFLTDITGEFVLSDYDSICEPESVRSFFSDSEAVIRVYKNGVWYAKRPPYREGGKAYKYLSPFVFSDREGYNYALCEDAGGFGFIDSEGIVRGPVYSKITQQKGKISGVLPDGKTKKIPYKGTVPAYFLK